MATPEQWAELPAKFPDDAAVQVKEAIAKNYHSSSNTFDALSAEFARLTKRFPRETWIRIHWLRESTRGGFKFENGGNYSQHERTFVSAKLRDELLEVARQSGRLEQDNAFFPWMEAVYAFSLKRNGEALAALQRAGKCTHFDDGIWRSVQDRVRHAQHFRVLDWEQKTQLAWSQLMPHYASLRGAASTAMWQARQEFLERRTNRALEIADSVQKAGLVIAKDSNFLIGKLVGEAIYSIAWRDEKTLNLPPEKFWTINKPKTTAQRLSAFMAFARRHNRDDIAVRAQEIHSSRRGQLLGKNFGIFDFGSRSSLGFRTLQVRALVSIFAHLSVFAATVWLGCWLLNYKSKLTQPKAPRILIVLAAFSLGATLACLAAAWNNGLIVDTMFLLLFADGQPPSAFISLLPIGLATLWIAPPLLIFLGNFIMQSTLSASEKETPHLRIELFLCDLVGVASLIALFLFWPEERGFYELNFSHLLFAVLIASAFFIRLNKFKKHSIRYSFKRNMFPHFGSYLRPNAATLAVAAALLCVTTNIARTAMDARMNQAVERQLQIGEVKWLEENLPRS